MNLVDFFVVISCLAVGYFFVSKLLSVEGSSGSDQDDSFQNHSEQNDTNKSSSKDQEANELSVRSCFQILGVVAGARPDEIRLAYKRMMAQYHPDKVSELGEKIHQAAEAESKRINQAYDYLKARGYAD